MDFFKNTKKEKENNNIQKDESTKVKEEATEDKENETKENVTNKTSADMLNSLINDEEVDGILEPIKDSNEFEKVMLKIAVSNKNMINEIID